jgi:polyisoprenyl-teichoic acid--peptidoglycan teichoic acid transferase
MKPRQKLTKKRKWIRYSLFFLGAVIIGLSIYLFNVYSNIANAVDTMNKPIDRKVSDKRDDKIQFNRKDPISILLVGVDERDGDSGRTDSMLVMTLNPKQKTSKLISIPRDTRANLIDENGKYHSYDKMNHAYAFGGIEMTINSIENFLNIPIDYYVEVNMEGFRDIVDAVGGIDVNNKYEFELDGVHLTEGDHHLNGNEALMYSRMRKADPRGDFGRQERQREVISKVIEKGTSLKALTNYKDLLSALEKNVKTNLTLDDMLGIQKLYKSAAETIEKIEIKGQGGLFPNGKQNVYYYIVDDENRQLLSDLLRDHLGLPKSKIKPNTSKNKIESESNNQTNTESTTQENNKSTTGTNNNTTTQNSNVPNSQTSSGTNNQTGNGGNGQTGNNPNNQTDGTNNQTDGGDSTQTGGETGTQTGDDSNGQTDDGSNNPPAVEPTTPPGSDSSNQTNSGTNSTGSSNPLNS